MPIVRNTADLVNLLFRKVWWTYRPGRFSWFDTPYHVFNLVEGSIWVILAGLVLRRYLRFRRSRIELLYAFAFLTFGFTDFQEAYALSSWLIWLKLINLSALVRLRSVVIRRSYPDNKLY